VSRGAVHRQTRKSHFPCEPRAAETGRPARIASRCRAGRPGSYLASSRSASWCSGVPHAIVVRAEHCPRHDYAVCSKSPLNTREKQVAQANSLKPTRRQSLWASISPPRRGFARSNGAVVESSDDREGVALPAPWTWATEASGSTRRVRRRVTRVGRR
jgi:hypothetical protein